MNKLLMMACFFSFPVGIKAQNLDRMSLTSGGMVNNKMNVVIGELFVFTMNNQGQVIETGSLGSVVNTGGISLHATSVSTAQANLKVLFYPNPVKEKLTFSVDNLKNTSVIINVIDISGKEILQSRTDSPENTTIDVTGLKSGQYILQLKSTNNLNIPSFKFIKQ
jgi:hypothetical protein